MPETTLTGWKHRITEYATANEITLGKSKIQRLAHRVNKRFMHYNDCDLARVLQHSDPVGEEAAKNVDDERRLAAEKALNAKRNGLDTPAKKSVQTVYPSPLKGQIH